MMLCKLSTHLLSSILLFLVCQSILASPIDRSAIPNLKDLSHIQQKNILECAKYFNGQISRLDIVKTTLHSDGQLVDWIPINSQGVIAQVPPPLLLHTRAEANNRTVLRPLAELELPGAERGPPGTVPIPRQNLSILNPNKTLEHRLSKPATRSQSLSRRAAGDHLYASSAQPIANNGGQGIFSMFSPFVQSSSDFSLLQTAVIKYNVPVPGNPSATTSQSVEAGWINYPAQIAGPHLFSYFTTNGYSANGDNLSGWNRDSAGWVQVDTTYFPGTTFGSLSTDGGPQYEMKIQYLLSGGNWWLWVIDRWIGYYPGSLFSNNRADASQTLAVGSSQINFYGEIFQSEAEDTTSDMGSGQFPETDWTHSAYIHNILYTDTSGHDQGYDGTPQLFSTDTNRYRIKPSFNSGSSWGSYFFLGGPGAGGVVGG